LVEALLLDTELERSAQRVGYGARVRADISGQPQRQGEANIVFNRDSCTRRRGLAGLVASAALVGLLLPATAQAEPSRTGCERRNNNEYDKLLECVTLAGVREHQAALQAIADANDDEFYPGSRRAGTQGYDESVEYVASVLERAGWEVSFDEVDFQFVFPALLQQLTPVNATY
jgi:hypothetical protein